MSTETSLRSTPTLDRAVATLAASIPAASDLRPGALATGSLTMTGAFGAAALSEVEGAVTGRLAILVDAALVAALEAAPGGPLKVADALQPAFDAAARALGATAGPARDANTSTVGALMGHPFGFISLDGDGPSAAVLLSDGLLKSVTGPTEAPMEESPTPAAATGAASVSMPPRPAAARLGEEQVSVTLPRTEEVPAQPINATDRLSGGRSVEILNGVIMDVTVELGRTQMSVRELLALKPGAVLELDRAAGSPADLLINGKVIGRGEVVVIDEDFGIRVTEVIASEGALV